MPTFIKPRLLQPKTHLACAGLTMVMLSCGPVLSSHASDYLRELQQAAIENGASPAAHWGWDRGNYMQWGTHSNRLIPVYTYGTRGAGEGIDLNSYTGGKSPYRSEATLVRLYSRLPYDTLNPQAEYLDQTNLYDIQKAALDAGKQHIILIVFDGMDWDTTRAAAIYNQQKVTYQSGRGTGTHFQEYDAGGTSQFGFMVTSPHNEGTKVNVDSQTLENPGGTLPGGYDAARGGPTPWSPPQDMEYLVAGPKDAPRRHAYTDSASSAVSMTAGIKTYNDAINVDPTGGMVQTIPHLAQDAGYAVGVVSSVPISHATPAAAYAHNVSRNDYQDLTRDLLGLPSVSHPEHPLPGMDVVIGGGFGTERDKDSGQGQNFIPGNSYLAAEDLKLVDVRNGGHYVVAQRTAGVSGKDRLAEAAAEAAREGHRLLGFYGYGPGAGHLPYQTADGDYQPAIGRSKKAEEYSTADLHENPTLAEMTRAALKVVENDPEGFWLLIEPGDVDWANHDNNLDNSIGAVNSGDEAFRVVTDWVEHNSSWDQTVVILTADHGHYLFLDQPELLVAPDSRSPAGSR